MENKSIPSNYYTDLTIHICDVNDTLVEKFQNKIWEVETNTKILLWYEDLLDRDLEYFLIATLDNEPISGCGYSDGKVLRYLYTLPKYRNKYRGLAQIDYVPIFVNESGRDKLYLSIDAYDDTHAKLSKAWDRVILSGIPPEKQPYRGLWKYIGVYKYRNTDQHFYELDLNDRPR